MNYKNKLEKILKDNPDTLKAEVIEEALDSGNNDSEIKTFFEDLLSHGCVSGMIGKLIYYKDTVEFYDKYEDEIENLLEEMRGDYGYKNRFEMIGSLNGAENVGNTMQEKNLLSWFAFEETARQLANEIGLEV